MSINSNGINFKPAGIDRRTVLKNIASIPVIGAMALGIYKKKKREELLRQNILEEINLSNPIPSVNPISKDSKKLRLGIIGIGGRGGYLLKSAGFKRPVEIDELKEATAINNQDKRYEDFLNQDDLNIEITGICDVFDVRAGRAIEACANIHKEGVNGKMGKAPKRYKNYKELLAADDIDAVIIASPDHWHAPMAIEAAKRGKHVYVEKPMTWNIPETYALRKAVKENNIILQVGHQGRQTESYIKAKEAIDKGVLGKISLVEVCTNRNDPNGAWVYPIWEGAGPHNIDWKQFEGQAPHHPFSLERFFRWRCWWDYGSGLNGDLLTHEFDAINQIMDVGIPETVTSSGGIYFFKDGRTVPDVQTTVLEFKENEMTMLYSASLASGRYRGKVFMGHDANMELSNSVIIKAEEQSTKYKEKIENNIIDPEIPIYTYIPGRNNIDAVATATEQYFASRGLLYTFRDGKRHDTAHLHIREWLESIRSGTQPSCNIDQGFEEAITTHMATVSLRTGKRIYWDKATEKVLMGEQIEKENFSDDAPNNLKIS